jgi:hypothetical protein
VLKLVVCPVLSAVLEAAATKVACATGAGGLLLPPPQAAKNELAKMLQAAKFNRVLDESMEISFV